MYKTFDEILDVEVKKFNPYHDKLGRFCGSDGASFMTFRTKDPKKQHMADAAVSRAKEQVENAKPKKVGIDSIENGDWDALKKYTEENLGMTITDGVKASIDFDCVREVAKGVEWVQSEFPKAQAEYRELSSNERGRYTIMSACNNGKISFNPKNYNTVEKFEDSLNSITNSGYHPKGTTIKGVGAHEAAHMLEYALDTRDFPVAGVADYYTLRDNYRARNNRRSSSKIVSEACKNAKKTSDGKGKVNDELKREISGYAAKNTAETIAESICDVFTNGDDAATLSKEVFKILKRELG